MARQRRKGTPVGRESVQAPPTRVLKPRAKRLLSYSAAAAAVLGSTAPAAATPTACSGTFPLTVTDVGSPDAFLDFNGDATNDLSFDIEADGDIKATGYPGITAYSSAAKVDGLASSDFIGPTPPPFFPPNPFTHSFTAGEFPEDTPTLMGARFLISGNTHYAWLRVEVDYDGSSGSVSLVVHECGYETTADTAIHTGDVPVELMEFLVE